MTIELLKRELSYNAEAGDFIRIRRPANNVKMGNIAGSKHPKGYIQIRICWKVYKAHRLAWLYMTGQWPSEQIDHIDGDPANNSWKNLRLASHGQNCANARKRKDNSSGVKGVRLFNGRWQVRVGNGGRIHVGTFDTLEDAQEAYLQAAKKEYGPFARGE